MLSLIVTQLSSLFIPSHGTSGQSFDPDDSGMVCVSAEDREKVCESESRIQCIVRYIDDACPKGKYEGTFPASTPVKELIDAVAEKFEEDSSEVTLEYQCSAGLLVFSEKTEGTLGTVGLDTEYGARNSMNLVLGRRANQKRDREYRRLRTNADRRAAVSSVRAGELGPEPPKPPALPSTAAANTSTSSGYVGLVNQAMTCYLNSLLQALFMTPEFRNALYKWQFDPSQGALPQKCIPFQLQKLFLNLQTSSKAAVETTELTKSFGWESGEVWQQHDIQELCRVMFDALETEFKNTEQADLINRLYQGKMIDYVKCLECGTEKAKEDVFLDIPLPVRPFMSTIAYKNIGEALKAFVLPETLNGNNQYFCEACNKKCDAHKGLKFCKFPYLLTMHLKRFDFDYNIMHRIKLNDKVVFPEILDLNGFIQNQIPVNSSPEQTIKCDGSSTTDPPEEGTNHLNEESSEPELKQPPILDEDDEVMDLSNYPNDSQENEKNINKSLNRGPFVYELYSIMIHSGSASGGHYYAYIKDFSRGEWYCFNDQSVTPITREDIIKTYGGGHNRMYYNGAHSSSTNAYMLMYRQIDKNLNCQAMSADEFPPHIKKILDEIAEHEERERALKAKEEEMVKLKITCNHPSSSQKTTKVYIHNEDTLSDALTVAIMQLKLDTVFPPEQCRLVSYDAERDHLELSFEGKEKSPIKEILEIAEQANRGLNSRVEFFLETREKDKKFFPYNLGDISMVVYLVDLENCDVVSATHLRTSPCQTVEDFKEFLKEAVPLDSKDVHIALARSKNVTYVCEKEPRNNGPRPLNKAGFFSESKVFIAPVTPEDGDISVNFEKSRFYRCVYDLRNVVVLQLTLPRNLEDQCDFLLIPLLDVNDSTRECNEASMDSGDTGARLNGIEEELVCSGASGTSDQSASEDSSLTDSERTIIGDTEVGASDCQVSSGSDSEQLLSPTATPAEDESPSSLCYTDSHGQSSTKSSQPLYFRAELITKVAGPPTPAGESKVIKVVVDKCMNMEMFKTKLEPYVGVAGKHLKVLQSPDSRNELITFNQSGDNDMLGIGLHRHLEPDEFTAKLYHFDINNSKNMLQTKLIELIICKNKTVGDSKADIVKQMAKKGWKVQIDRLRIRIKEWNSPGKILLDNSLWDDHVQIDTLELCFQILDGPERVTSNTFLSAFARRWRPSSMTLGPLTDIVVDKEEEFLQRLAELTDQVPAENIEFAKGPMHTNVLTVRDLSWTSNQEVLVDWMKISYGQPLVIYHRDNREEPKILTEEEEGEIARIELSNLTTGNSTYISSYSPRKERALKIYTSSNKILELD